MPTTRRPPIAVGTLVLATILFCACASPEADQSQLGSQMHRLSNFRSDYATAFCQLDLNCGTALLPPGVCEEIAVPSEFWDTGDRVLDEDMEDICLTTLGNMSCDEFRTALMADESVLHIECRMAV